LEIKKYSFQDKGHFELEFELKVEKFDGSLAADANPEMKEGRNIFQA